MLPVRVDAIPNDKLCGLGVSDKSCKLQKNKNLLSSDIYQVPRPQHTTQHRMELKYLLNVDYRATVAPGGDFLSLGWKEVSVPLDSGHEPLGNIT